MTETTLVPNQVLVVYQDEEVQGDDSSKGLFANVKERVVRVAPLNLEEFQNNLTNLCTQLGNAFGTITPTISGYNLESFELSVDVTAKGEVKFIGSVGTDIKGGVKLVFRRKSNRQ